MWLCIPLPLKIHRGSPCLFFTSKSTCIERACSLKHLSFFFFSFLGIAVEQVESCFLPYFPFPFTSIAWSPSSFSSKSGLNADGEVTPLFSPFFFSTRAMDATGQRTRLSYSLFFPELTYTREGLMFADSRLPPLLPFPQALRHGEEKRGPSSNMKRRSSEGFSFSVEGKGLGPSSPSPSRQGLCQHRPD